MDKATDRTYKIAEWVYIHDEQAPEYHLRVGRVTGVRAVTRLGRVDFVGKGNDSAVPFLWADLRPLPDNVTHHLITRPGGTNPFREPMNNEVCRYCGKTRSELKAGRSTERNPSNQVCPVAFRDAVGEDMNTSPLAGE